VKEKTNNCFNWLYGNYWFNDIEIPLYFVFNICRYWLGIGARVWNIFWMHLWHLF